MSFDTEILKPASDRFMLVRIEVNVDGFGRLSSVGGGVYEWSTSDPVYSVTRNGTALTEVSATPSNNDEWYYDGETLSVKLAAAPNQSSNVVVVSYYLFFTDGRGRKAPETPTDAATTSRLWSPRLIAKPGFSETFKNVREGLLTYSDVDITLANTDETIQSHLTSDHSFKDKTVTIWSCVNTVDNIRFSYSGAVKSVSLSEGIVNFKTRQAISRLDKPAILAGGSGVAFYNETNEKVTRANPRDLNAPIPFVFGESSYKVTDAMTPATSLIYYDNGGDVFLPIPGLDPSSLHGAFPTDYTEEALTTSNRKHILCRSDAFRTQSFGTVNSATLWRDQESGGGDPGLAWNSGGTSGSYKLLILDLTGHNLEVGDSFLWGSASAGISSANAWVCAINPDDTTAQGAAVDRTLTARTGDEIWCLTLRAVTTTTSNTSVNDIIINGGLTLRIPGLIYHDPRFGSTNQYRPLFYDADFNLSNSVTSPAEDVLPQQVSMITLVNNFENNVRFDVSPLDGTNNAYDPNQCRILWRHKQLTSASGHSDAVETILNTTGELDVNAAAITAAQSSLDVNVSFTVPAFGQTDYPTYTALLEHILKSTLGYIYVNTSGEYVYKLLAAPSSGDAVTSTEYQGLSCEVDYQDVVTEIIFSNDNITERDGANKSRFTVSDSRLQYLYGGRITKEFKHVLTDISGRAQAIFDSIAYRRATYQMVLPQKYLATLLGDDISLSSGFILGTGSTDNLKIVSLESDGDQIAIQAEDLDGV